MPYSDPDGKPQILTLITTCCTLGNRILDVGPGAGTYADLLAHRGIIDLDAVEIFTPYIERFRLREKYRIVYNCSIVDFTPPEHYRLAIFGDVLEHLSVPDAINLVGRMQHWCDVALFSVPWTYPQGVVDDNEAERHLQPDLTPETMAQRYPALALHYKGPVIGIYTWYKS